MVQSWGCVVEYREVKMMFNTGRREFVVKVVVEEWL